jgi:hypothetical protein
MIRSGIESYLIAQRFLDSMPDDLFIEAFSTHFRNPNSKTAAELACERAFLHATNEHGYSRLIGADRLRALFEDPETAETLRTTFNFTWRDFSELLTTMDLMRLEHNAAVSALQQTNEEHYRAKDEHYRSLDDRYRSLDAHYRCLEDERQKTERAFSALEGEYAHLADGYRHLEAELEKAAQGYTALEIGYRELETGYKKIIDENNP